MKKRGVIDVYFNWIFILIAGAVILFFFISIINKQMEFSEVKTSGTIITSLESILTGAQVSTNTVNMIDMPAVDIGFECNRYFIGPVPRQTKGNVIFSPSLLKGKKLVTWALDWNMPYRVTNFLYLTDPQVRYVIVNDADTEAIAKKLYDELPKETEMNKELLDKNNISKFKDKNNYKVKFIFFKDKKDSVLTELKYMPDEDVTAIVLTDIESQEGIPDTGTIDFYKKNVGVWGENDTTYYLKKESLFGAIFSEDAEMYNCVMRKAFKKLNIVSRVYFERSSELMGDYGFANVCYEPHKTDRLWDMIQYSDKQSNEFPASKTDIEDMQTISVGIKEQNHNAQLFSCALIY